MDRQITKGVGRDELPALGILAVALSDGSVSFFAVPEPSAARKAFKVAEAEPVFRARVSSVDSVRY